MDPDHPTYPPPDLVYVVGPGDRNEELRYSLRSVAANLAHGRVWIVGHRPPWVRAEHVAVPKHSSKYRSTTLNVRTACETPLISDPFILMNDDFFVMRPIRRGVGDPAIPAFHRGPVVEVLAAHETLFRRSAYGEGMRATAALLHSLGHSDPLSYELHIPLVVRKAEMLHALDVGEQAGIPVLHKRTLYGNLAGLGGRLVPDCKVDRVRRTWSTSWTFLSTDSPRLDTPAGHHIRGTFPGRCMYEFSE